jgi:hypothetical protein
MSSRHVTKRERKFNTRKQTPSHGRTKQHRSHKAYRRVQKGNLIQEIMS